jgi:hypothetical protein
MAEQNSPRTSRRDFLRLSALTAAAAASGFRPLGARESGAGALLDSRANSFPGRIVTYRDPAMNGHLATIDRDRVEAVVHASVQALTGITETGPAFRSLLPGLTTTSRIAIKVNCIGPCDTRWETARAVVSGLAQMMGGAYDVSNVTVYDNQYITAHGYSASDFTFNGHTAALSNTSNPGSYYVYGSHRLSSYIVDGQFVIDIPVIKCHTDTNNQITAALKNHYGSCTPSSLCGDTSGMLTVNADPHIKGKTALVVLDCLRGTYTGGPGDPPQSWNLYPEHSPNTICVSTDPVTIDYWARDKINDERALHSLSPKPCPWIEQATGAPYGLGVSDPAHMTVISVESGGVDDGPAISRGMLLLPPAPNPFRDRTVARFRLARPGTALLAIYTADGRLVTRLRGEFDAGPGEMMWDGRDGTGRPVVPGMYVMRLESAGSVSTRKVIRGD